MRIIGILLILVGVISGLFNIVVGLLFCILGVILVLAKKQSTVPPSATKKCPKCAEEVKLEAQICRFCGYNFTEINEETSLSLQGQTEDSTKKRISCSDGNCIGVINEKGICNICGRKSKEEVKSREEAKPWISVEEKEREGREEEKRLSMEGKAEKRGERESQIKGKSIPRFSNREEYEKWKGERLKGMDKKDK